MLEFSFFFLSFLLPRLDELTLSFLLDLVSSSILFCKKFFSLIIQFSMISLFELLHSKLNSNFRRFLLRKEVIHPHVPVGIPCYDFTPIISPTLDSSFLAVRPPASGVINSRGVTGGVYKARERIHRDMLIRDY